MSNPQKPTYEELMKAAQEMQGRIQSMTLTLGQYAADNGALRQSLERMQQEQAQAQQAGAAGKEPTEEKKVVAMSEG